MKRFIFTSLFFSFTLTTSRRDLVWLLLHQEVQIIIQTIAYKVVNSLGFIRVIIHRYRFSKGLRKFSSWTCSSFLHVFTFSMTILKALFLILLWFILLHNRSSSSPSVFIKSSFFIPLLHSPTPSRTHINAHSLFFFFVQICFFPLTRCSSSFRLLRIQR